MKRFSVLIISLLLLASCQPRETYHKAVGKVFGTYYAVTYCSHRDLSDQFPLVLDSVNRSLSPFDSLSIISRINRNAQPVAVDAHFKKVYAVARTVSEASHGAFDLTVAPLVNQWGFGFAPQTQHTDRQIDSLRRLVGYQKIRIVSDSLYKDLPATQLDASAVAKGYGCDLLAAYLQQQGVKHYLVDIGGEIVAAGQNPQGKAWRIGISRPISDATNDVQRILEVSDTALATSGNYRQFYVTKERTITHTIDPRSGYPVDGKVLSATVLASSCTLADACATAMMVLNQPESIRAFAQRLPEHISYYLIVDSLGTHTEITYP